MTPWRFLWKSGRLIKSPIPDFWSVGATEDPQIPNLPLENAAEFAGESDFGWLVPQLTLFPHRVAIAAVIGSAVAFVPQPPVATAADPAFGWYQPSAPQVVSRRQPIRDGFGIGWFQPQVPTGWLATASATPIARSPVSRAALANGSSLAFVLPETPFGWHAATPAPFRQPKSTAAFLTTSVGPFFVEPATPEINTGWLGGGSAPTRPISRRAAPDGFAWAPQAVVIEAPSFGWFTPHVEPKTSARIQAALDGSSAWAPQLITVEPPPFGWFAHAAIPQPSAPARAALEDSFSWAPQDADSMPSFGWYVGPPSQSAVKPPRAVLADDLAWSPQSFAPPPIGSPSFGWYVETQMPKQSTVNASLFSSAALEPMSFPEGPSNIHKTALGTGFFTNSSRGGRASIWKGRTR
jgi:hypothetical protein